MGKQRGGEGSKARHSIKRGLDPVVQERAAKWARAREDKARAELNRTLAVDEYRAGNATSLDHIASNPYM